MRRAFVSILVVLAAAAAAPAGTVEGRLRVLEKGGRAAADVVDAVVWVEGPAVKPQPSSATVVMKGKAFVPRVAVVCSPSRLIVRPTEFARCPVRRLRYFPASPSFTSLTVLADQSWRIQRTACGIRCVARRWAAAALVKSAFIVMFTAPASGTARRGP